jgi:hypothetical protein
MRHARSRTIDINRFNFVRIGSHSDGVGVELRLDKRDPFRHIARRQVWRKFLQIGARFGAHLPIVVSRFIIRRIGD